MLDEIVSYLGDTRCANSTLPWYQLASFRSVNSAKFKKDCAWHGCEAADVEPLSTPTFRRSC